MEAVLSEDYERALADVEFGLGDDWDDEDEDDLDDWDDDDDEDEETAPCLGCREEFPLDDLDDDLCPFCYADQHQSEKDEDEN